MIDDYEIDNHKLIYHPERICEWMQKKDCFPIYVEVGLTNRCNHRCIFCALDWFKTKKTDIKKEIMLSALGNMVDSGVKSIMFAGEGEPLLHKDFSLFVKRSKEKGLDIAVTTNGVFFDEKIANACLPYLSWIRFSIDAGTSETYAKIHGAKKEEFSKVISNIKRTIEIKNKMNYQVVVGLQCLLIPQNFSEIESLAKMAKEIGVNNLQLKPYSHHPKSKNDFSIKYTDLKNLKQKLEVFNDEKFAVIYRDKTIDRLEQKQDYPKCYGLPFFALIDSNGNVLPCNLFYNNEDFFYGNIYKNSFNKIWKSNRRKEVLKKIKEKGICECRKGCRLDVINRYLYRLEKPHFHDKFI
ncbi:MAG: radical SAM protein [Candidatus Firestonebacteria bacterium]